MKREEQRRRSRAAILVAASEQFVQRGYAATSLSDVAASLGLVRGTVHFHFATKERLAETITALLPEALDDLAGQVPDNEATRDRSTLIVRALARQFAEDVRLRAALRIASEDPTGRAMDPFVGRLVSMGASPPGSPQHTGDDAWVAASALIGLFLSWAQKPPDTPLPDLASTMWTRLSCSETQVAQV